MSIFPNGFEKIVDRLDRVSSELGVGWMLIGAASVAMWGEPRSSKDVDAIFALDIADEKSVMRVMRTHGFVPRGPLKKLPRGDLFLQEYTTDVRGTPVTVDFFFSDEEWQREAVNRRIQVRFHSRHLWVSTPEDLILFKLIAFRGKDLDDIVSIITEQYSDLRWGYLHEKAAELGVVSDLEDVVENYHLAEGIREHFPWEE